MIDFKIKVTPEESEVIQKLLFLAGYSWFNGDVVVKNTNAPYLFVEDKKISYSVTIYTFNDEPIPELTFEEFVNEIEIELNDNTCV